VTTLTDQMVKGESEPTVGASLDDQGAWLVSAAIGIFAFLIYLRTLCPTVYTFDCGEITTAVANGGVMHPPGYPLYTMIGWLFVHLIPFGEPAWRLGLLSAIPAAIAAALLVPLGRRLGAQTQWAALGAVGFALSISLWQQATKVETYGLNALFVALILLLSVKLSQEPAPRCLYLLSLIVGLSLTNHLTTLWLLPGALLLAWNGLRSGKLSAWHFMRAALLLVLPLLLYGEEVIAARLHPGGQIWGDPSTPYALWLQVSGHRYHMYLHMISWHEKAHRDFVWLPQWLWINCGPLLLLSVFGAVKLLKADRTKGLGLLVCIGTYVACNTAYGIPNIFEYYTPVILALMALAAVGASAVASGIARSTHWGERRRVGLVAAAFVAMTAITCNFHHCDRSRATWLRTYAENVLEWVPRNSMVMAPADDHVFALWYCQKLLGVRPDVMILPRWLGWDLKTPAGRQESGWNYVMMAKADPDLDVRPMLRRCAADKAYAESEGPLWDIVWIEQQKHRPFFHSFEFADDFRPTGPTGMQFAHWAGPPQDVVVEGMQFRVCPPGEKVGTAKEMAVNLRLEPKIVLDIADPDQWSDDPTGQLGLPRIPFVNIDYANWLAYTGNQLNKVRIFEFAYDRLARAHEYDPASPSIANNCALSAMMTGKRSEAIALWKEAVREDPANLHYQHNLATALATLSRPSN
jgi:hypothetical protein